MIRIKLSEVLGRKKMTRKKLAELANVRPNTIGDMYNEKVLGRTFASSANVRPNTIGDMYNEKVRKIDLDTLDRICAVLKCNISDLLQYQDENGEK